MMKLVKLPASFRVLLLLPALVLAGCGTVYDDVSRADQVPAGSVIVVGRIEIVPPINTKEQDIKIMHDVANMKERYVNRAALFVSSENTPGKRGTEAMNPVLEKTFFIPVPKSRRYMVEGTVMMGFSDRLVSRRQVAVDTSELIIPPAEFDIRNSDRAIYIGTLRLHRDEFHTVTKAYVVDAYKSATAEFQKKFGRGIPLRRALLKPL